MGNWRELAILLDGDVRENLKVLSEGSVHCCVTSPPYWGLRDYKLEPLAWGGRPDCRHEWAVETIERENRTGLGLKGSPASTRGGGHKIATVGWQRFERGSCPLCGAWRGSLGLEPTPELYVQHLVEVFREVRRVLRPDGTLWLNLGDSYASTPPGCKERSTIAPGLKPKDLVGIPWRVAFALQADGWWLRSDIIWHKPNVMPESVTDRPTKSHEYIFLLSKSERYYYDAEAVREEASTSQQANGVKGRPLAVAGYISPGFRNRRSVWSIATYPVKDAHFATFPPALVEPCILAGCPPDGMVLDPFVGSGTTCLVATRLGRQSIGIDLSREYLEIAEKRLGANK